MSDHNPFHPCYRVTTPADLYHMKKLQIYRLHPPCDSYHNPFVDRKKLYWLYTMCVGFAISSYDTHILLNGWLPCLKSCRRNNYPWKSGLYRLCSGHCFLLNSYKNRLNNHISCSIVSIIRPAWISLISDGHLKKWQTGWCRVWTSNRQHPWGFKNNSNKLLYIFVWSFNSFQNQSIALACNLYGILVSFKAKNSKTFQG